MKERILTTLAILMLAYLTAGFACSFTTANISELKFGSNDRAEPPLTNFNAGQDIYAVATVSNAGGKYKLKWRFTYENVPGKGKGEEIGTKTVDFEGAKILWQQFSSPLPGEYKAEATLIAEDGKVIDTKTGTVTIKSPPARPAMSKEQEQKEDAGEE